MTVEIVVAIIVVSLLASLVLDRWFDRMVRDYYSPKRNRR
jgi:type II secretory pathway pseudopilin PulG